MQNAMLLIQLVLASLTVVLVLMQARGTGFGRGSATSFTRRGLESFVFKSTFVVVFLFLLVSILRLFV